MPVIDYAEQIISIKQLVRSMEELLIRKDWDQASIDVLRAITELRVMNANIALLKENGGIPYQTHASDKDSDPSLS
jgi:hypothetical protein